MRHMTSYDLVRVYLIYCLHYSHIYGNPDCQASEGFAKHVAQGDAEGCCCNQTFSRYKRPRKPQIYHATLNKRTSSYRSSQVEYIILMNKYHIIHLQRFQVPEKEELGLVLTADVYCRLKNKKIQYNIKT